MRGLSPTHSVRPTLRRITDTLSCASWLSAFCLKRLHFSLCEEFRNQEFSAEKTASCCWHQDTRYSENYDGQHLPSRFWHLSSSTFPFRAGGKQSGIIEDLEPKELTSGVHPRQMETWACMKAGLADPFKSSMCCFLPEPLYYRESLREIRRSLGHQSRGPQIPKGIRISSSPNPAPATLPTPPLSQKIPGRK